MCKEAERIGSLLINQGWPKNGVDAKSLKEEVERTQAALRHDARLALLDKLAVELRFTIRLKSMGEMRQMERLRDLAAKIAEAAK